MFLGHCAGAAEKLVGLGAVPEGRAGDDGGGIAQSVVRAARVVGDAVLEIIRGTGHNTFAALGGKVRTHASVLS